MEKVRQWGSHERRPERTPPRLPQSTPHPAVTSAHRDGKQLLQDSDGPLFLRGSEKRKVTGRNQSCRWSQEHKWSHLSLLHYPKRHPASVFTQQGLVAYLMATQTLLPNRPSATMSFSGQGCCTCPFTVKMGQGGTKRCPAESPRFYYMHYPCPHYGHNSAKLRSKCPTMGHWLCKLRHNYKMGYYL